MFFTHKVLVPFGVAALLATGGAAFLAQNSAPVSGQGVSLSSVDGYLISNISYNVAAPTPSGPTPQTRGGPPASPRLQVTQVSFDATVAVAGELPALQGFVKLDPPTPGAPAAWTQCARNYLGHTSSFTCTLSPGVPVNGGPGQIGVLNNLGIEVNQ